MSEIAVLIPARLGSTRLPNKPLADIKGKSMIVRVCERAAESGYENIIVACCEEEVRLEVEGAGYKAIMTDPELPSGTDRIYAALQELPICPDIIVNLQGDLPNIDVSVINDTVRVLENNAAPIELPLSSGQEEMKIFSKGVFLIIFPLSTEFIKKPPETTIFFDFVFSYSQLSI